MRNLHVIPKYRSPDWFSFYSVLRPAVHGRPWAGAITSNLTVSLIQTSQQQLPGELSVMDAYDRAQARFSHLRRDQCVFLMSPRDYDAFRSHVVREDWYRHTDGLTVAGISVLAVSSGPYGLMIAANT